MEPEWTKKIPSTAICSFYYAFFIAYALIGAISVVGLVIAVFTLKMSKGMLAMMVFQNLIVIALSVVLALFQYLVCDRALIAPAVQHTAKNVVEGGLAYAN
jgi:hypothetical protein